MSEKRPMLYPLADALEMKFTVEADGRLAGSSKNTLDLFEGYSPTIVSRIVNSLTHFSYGVTGVVIQVWGNLHVVLVNEDQFKQLTLFVIDRSKIPTEDRDLFAGNKWSRKDLYRLVEPGLAAIYYRCSYETKWKRMENCKQRLRAYNAARREGQGAKQAWEIFWDEGKP